MSRHSAQAYCAATRDGATATHQVEVGFERYKNIHGRINLMLKLMGWGGAAAAGLMISICAWA